MHSQDLHSLSPRAPVYENPRQHQRHLNWFCDRAGTGTGDPHYPQDESFLSLPSGCPSLNVVVHRNQGEGIVDKCWTFPSTPAGPSFPHCLALPWALSPTHDLCHRIEADDSQTCMSWAQPLPWILTYLFNCLLDLFTLVSQTHLKINLLPKPTHEVPPPNCPCCSVSVNDIAFIWPQESSLIVSSLTTPVTIISQVLLILTSKNNPTHVYTSIHHHQPNCLAITLISHLASYNSLQFWSPCFRSAIHPSYFDHNGLLKTGIATLHPQQRWFLTAIRTNKYKSPKCHLMVSMLSSPSASLHPHSSKHPDFQSLTFAIPLLDTATWQVMSLLSSTLWSPSSLHGVTAACFQILVQTAHPLGILHWPHWLGQTALRAPLTYFTACVTTAVLYLWAPWQKGLYLFLLMILCPTALSVACNRDSIVFGKWGHKKWVKYILVTSRWDCFMCFSHSNNEQTFEVICLCLLSQDAPDLMSPAARLD